MTRGGTSFAEKATAARDAGCVAAIIHNNQPGNFNGTLGAAGDWLPVVSISLDEGLYLKDQIERGPTTTTLVNVLGDYAIFSGTSMASPHAAGVAALVLSANPSLTPDQVRQILRQSSVDLGTPGWGSAVRLWPGECTGGSGIGEEVRQLHPGTFENLPGSCSFESSPFSSSMCIRPTMIPRTNRPAGSGGPSTSTSNGSPSYEIGCGTNPVSG
jgi:hypothetical protein